MTDNELNAAIARLCGFDEITIEMPYGEIPDYSTDVGAAMQACLALGWLPQMHLVMNGEAVNGNYHTLLIALGDVERHVDTRTMTSREGTQAIARALCEALREAAGVQE
jgi:hypothetical protein